jgi:exonuclease V
MNDGETDYGSDFSPEEEQIVTKLLSGTPVDIEDNPIVNGVEYAANQPALRLPRVLGRETRYPLFEAARAAKELSEPTSESIKTGEYSDCKPGWYQVIDKSD